MNRYNIFYKTGNRIIKKSNMTKEEVYDFLDSLGKEDESELRVMKVEDNDKGEER